MQRILKSAALCHRRGCHTTRTRARGTASIEALIVIPVFFILFLGVQYASRLAELGHDAEMTARSCAWRYSANSCTQIPSGCEGYLSPGTSSNHTGNEIDDTLKAGEAGLRHGGNGGNFVSGVIGSLLESAIQDTFGRHLDTSVPAVVDRPELFGGKQVTVTGNYHLACNLSYTTLGDVAANVWSHLPHP